MWPNYATVAVSPSGEILLDGVPTELENLAKAIGAVREDQPVILFSPDPLTPYGTAALVLGEIAKAGIDPLDICFDRLERFRVFDDVALTRIHTILGPEEENASWPTARDIPPSGCAQFLPSEPLII